MGDIRTGSVYSADVLTARTELAAAKDPLHAWRSQPFDCAAYSIGPSLWTVITLGETQIALRAARDPREEALGAFNVDVREDEIIIDCASSIAAHRIRLSTHVHDNGVTLRCKAGILPVNDLLLPIRRRDLFLLPVDPACAEPAGRLYSSQRGLQTGSLFAAIQHPADLSLLYVQNFGSLASYFAQTNTTPAGSVGGTWPELGFELPVSSTNMLLASNEYTISDVYLTLRHGAPRNDGEAAEQYLDALANTVTLLEAPAPHFHYWPSKARATVFDLSQSPLCRRDVGEHRFLTPYVDDFTKPPESMVQLSVLVALMEYEVWSGEQLCVVRDLTRCLGAFFDDEIGSVVRWLPGAHFDQREDEHQTHEAMDSWYLYHVLFNLTRLTRAGVPVARRLLKKSLPYAVRVARRFGYRWPIFFNLKTLDIIQAEATKGSGGENDVSGLYALVMIHAYDIFDEPEYLEEAKRAAHALEGLGFRVAYQTNTTGFAAEAMLRLALLTGEERYRTLSHICIANIFDTMAIWQRSYGYSQSYSTFFSLYPLRDAPYVAAYEELEMLAKTYEYLRLGGDTVPPSVKLLMCEYTRHLLSRGWGYYPGELPEGVIAPKARNGRVVRELAVPLEDLQDGTKQSGAVGQEVYGAGLALVCTTRHFHRVPGTPLLLFCEFPLFAESKLRFRVAGTADMHCALRLISTDPNLVPDEKMLRMKRTGTVRRSVEGHVLVEVCGGEVVTVRSPARKRRKRRA